MLLLFALLVQDPPPEPPAVSIERIRRGIETATVRFELPPPDRRLFRVLIEQPEPFEFPVMWTDRSVHPGYIHTPAPPVHHEFLASVTPEDFRAGVLYPVGIPVLSTLNPLVKAVQRHVRTGAERRIRAQIARELRDLAAARSGSRDAGKSPPQ